MSETPTTNQTPTNQTPTNQTPTNGTPEHRSAADGHEVVQPQGVCVIMAGGRGTRFWPLSRTARPKQLLPLSSGRSLLRETYDRVLPLVGARRILVIASGDLAPAIRLDLPDLPPEHIIIEPVGRNTAPCAVLGMGLAQRLDPSAPVALLPADHHIPDGAAFARQLADAFTLAANPGTVVTFGIRPTHPHTGYGYLEVAPGGDGGPLDGLCFVEKPDAATATGYVDGGRHYWNSGIFVWNPGWFAEMADRHLPAVRARMAPPVAAFGTAGFAAALDAAYAGCPAASVDQAIMEKLSGFTVLPATFAWSDLGDWEAWGQLAGETPSDDASFVGLGDVLSIGSAGNIVRGDKRLVALVGVDDLVVVDTPDALLICRRGQTQRLRDVIEELEKRGRRDLL
jgi:mannose-1-phosphate guanylyltransferase